MVDVVVNDVMATSTNVTDLSTYMFKNPVGSPSSGLTAFV